MSKLLVKPSAPDSRGRVHSITPASAGWTYVGFDVYRLKAGQSFGDETGDREACIVMLAGKAHVSAGGKNFGVIGGRASPFEPDPWSFYVPAHSDWSLTGGGRLRDRRLHLARRRQVARAGDPARPGWAGNARQGHQYPPCPQHPARDRASRKPARGRGDHAVGPLVELSAAQARPRRPAERIACSRRPITTASTRPQGLRFQRVYTDDRSLDETLAASDGDVVLVPKRLSPGRRAAWLRALLSQRDGGAEAGLEIP